MVDEIIQGLEFVSSLLVGVVTIGIELHMRGSFWGNYLIHGVDIGFLNKR